MHHTIVGNISFGRFTKRVLSSDAICIDRSFFSISQVSVKPKLLRVYNGPFEYFEICESLNPTLKKTPTGFLVAYREFEYIESEEEAEGADGCSYFPLIPTERFQIKEKEIQLLKVWKN
jgi:hypothetical protein